MKLEGIPRNMHARPRHRPVQHEERIDAYLEQRAIASMGGILPPRRIYALCNYAKRKKHGSFRPVFWDNKTMVGLPVFETFFSPSENKETIRDQTTFTFSVASVPNAEIWKGTNRGADMNFEDLRNQILEIQIGDSHILAKLNAVSITQSKTVIADFETDFEIEPVLATLPAKFL